MTVCAFRQPVFEKKLPGRKHLREIPLASAGGRRSTLQMRLSLRLAALVLACLEWTAAAAPALNAAQQALLGNARRFERHGWTYVHMEGEARSRGFQHGYLLAPEIAEGLRVTRAGWEHQSSMTWPWLVERAATLLVPKIDAENLAELDGIAEGARAAGCNVTRDDIVAYNGIIELAEYWWPGELKRIKGGPAPPVKDGCSSFVATGRWTKDGNIVLGHNTMSGYNDAFPNVIADIAPAHGHRILWQTCAGWIHSGTDFFITDAGLAGSETTIGGFEGFDTNGIPEFVRMRRATQDAGGIDEWCEIMRRGNNGGYANAWLLGDANTKEIARLELGLKYIALERSHDGFFLGSNVAENPKILRLETDTDETDIRQSSVARRVRWKKLMDRNKGKIDLGLARRFEADHYDSFFERNRPGGRSLCGHNELEREPGGGAPYRCGGTLDGKVVDATETKQMRFEARWGSACGRAFIARDFLTAHPQYYWMTGILQDRPSQPWADFRAGE